MPEPDEDVAVAACIEAEAVMGQRDLNVAVLGAADGDRIEVVTDLEADVLHSGRELHPLAAAPVERTDQRAVASNADRALVAARARVAVPLAPQCIAFGVAAGLVAVVDVQKEEGDDFIGRSALGRHIRANPELVAVCVGVDGPQIGARLVRLERAQAVTRELLAPIRPALLAARVDRADLPQRGSQPRRAPALRGSTIRMDEDGDSND
jgi:hypothetical protein